MNIRSENKHLQRVGTTTEMHNHSEEIFIMRMYLLKPEFRKFFVSNSEFASDFHCLKNAAVPLSYDACSIIVLAYMKAQNVKVKNVFEAPFSMPEPFCLIFDQVVAEPNKNIDARNMHFGQIQRLIGHMTTIFKKEDDESSKHVFIMGLVAEDGEKTKIIRADWRRHSKYAKKEMIQR
jgi:hypothetical protein